MIAVVKSDGDRSKTERLPRLRAGKYDILHIPPAELLCALLAKDPADSVAYITFSAAVRSHDTCDSVMKFKIDLLGKGFEPVHFYVF